MEFTRMASHTGRSGGIVYDKQFASFLLEKSRRARSRPIRITTDDLPEDAVCRVLISGVRYEELFREWVKRSHHNNGEGRYITGQ